MHSTHLKEHPEGHDDVVKAVEDAIGAPRRIHLPGGDRHVDRVVIVAVGDDLRPIVGVTPAEIMSRSQGLTHIRSGQATTWNLQDSAHQLRLMLFSGATK